MTKTKYNKRPLIYPVPAVVVGAVVDGRPNFVTLGNCGILCTSPAVIYISTDKSHYTNKGIKENQVFSINIPSAGLAAKVDYCGLVSGRNTDKSKVFECFYRSSDRIPMIKECPVNMECKLVRTIDIYNMEMFIGEVIDTYIDQDALTNGYPDTKRINPLIYSIDRSYWQFGDFVDKAFKTENSYSDFNEINIFKGDL